MCHNSRHGDMHLVFAYAGGCCNERMQTKAKQTCQALSKRGGANMMADMLD